MPNPISSADLSQILDMLEAGEKAMQGEWVLSDHVPGHIFADTENHRLIANCNGHAENRRVMELVQENHANANFIVIAANARTALATLIAGVQWECERPRWKSGIYKGGQIKKPCGTCVYCRANARR